MSAQQKLFIASRENKRIAVVVEAAHPQKGMAFVMHGLGGSKTQMHIRTFINTFKENGYTVVSFDTTNTFGESDGNYEDATTTNYLSDLEDVISWSAEQKWYMEPFVLCGHSLGGLCTGLFAEKNQKKVKALAPLATTVSGTLSMKHQNQEELNQWKETGLQIKKSSSIPNITKKLKWSHMEDRMNHDLLKHVDKLTMPTILIVGEKDESTPPIMQKILFDKLPGKKEMHIIKNAEHGFKEKEQLSEVKSILNNW